MGLSLEPPILTSKPEIDFAHSGLQPPSQLYITRDDQLCVFSQLSVGVHTLTMNYRLLLPNGEIQSGREDWVPTPSRLPELHQFQLAEGFLLSLYFSIEPLGSVHRGQLWVTALLMRGGADPAILLFNGTRGALLVNSYVTNTEPAGWPWGESCSSVGGTGNPRAIVGTDPAAGAECLDTVPTNSLWRLIGWQAPLVTSAAVANRRPHLIIDDGAGNIVFEASAATLQTASLTVRYVTGDGVVPVATVDNVAILALPSRPLLPTGFRIRTLTTALDAADNWGAPVLWVEDFLVAAFV